MKGKSAMGLSASQARLLSITARLTHNETRSQLITNSKLRLADKSSEASKEYMEALNSTKLVYANYDSTGTRQTEAFTFGSVTQYSDIKNQYGFVDSAGRLLVSATDAKNYQNSATLAAFLSCYEIGDMANPKYDPALEDIYGENFGDFFNENDPHGWEGIVNNATNGAIGQMVQGGGTTPSFSENLLHDENAYNNWVNSLKNGVQNIDFGDNKTEGLFNTWIDSITDVPEFEAEPTAPKKPEPPEQPQLGDVWDKFKDSVCLDSTGGSETDDFKLPSGGTLNTYHAEHALSHALHAAGEEITFTAYPGTPQETTFTLKPSSNGSFDNSNTAYSEATNGPVAAELRDALDDYPDIKQNLINTYYEIIRVQCSANESGGTYNDNGTPTKSMSELVTMWNTLMEQLSGADPGEVYDQMYQDYLEELDYYNTVTYPAYQEEYKQWKNDFIGGLTTWYEQMQNAKQNYSNAIDNLPAKFVPDEENPKYQWYTNLWFRMGGISDAEKQDNQNNYKILDEYYMYNDEWLQFALEHGIITMEQVQYQEEGETLVEQMNQYAWVSIQYSNCADLYEETDDVAIAKAEAEYQRKTTEIQAKDKKYDTDLKKLDTEHNALQTEYDSIKSVIEKNVERSFKAFS